MDTNKREFLRTYPVRNALRDTIILISIGVILPQILYQGGVLTLLILSLGGSELEVGIISSVTNLCLVTSIFMVPYLEVRSRKRLLTIWWPLSAVCITFLLLIYPMNILFGPTAAFWFLVFVIFTHQTSSNMTGSVWMPYLFDLIPSPIRGRYFGRLRTTWRITSFVVTILAGWLLGKEPSFLRFYIVFIGCLFLYYYRLIYIKRLPDIPPTRSGKPESILKNIKKPFKNLRFKRFLLFSILVYTLDFAAFPFVIPFLKMELGFPASFAVYASACLSLGSIVSLSWWGKLTDRWGNRAVFGSSLVVSSLYLIIFIVTPPYEQAGLGAFLLAACGYILRGFGMAGFGIAYTVRMMYEAEEEYIGAYMTVARILMGIFIGF